jgi:hypothetical protein
MQFAVRTLAPDMSIASQVVDAPGRGRRAPPGGGARPVRQRRRTGRPSGLRRARGGKLSLVLFSQELLALLSAGLGIVEGARSPARKRSQSRHPRRARAPAGRPARRQALFQRAGRAARPVSAAVHRHRARRRRHQRPAAFAVALHRLPAAHRRRAQQDRQRRDLSGHPADGRRRRQRLPDRLCGAALCRGLPGRRPQPAVDVARCCSAGASSPASHGARWLPRRRCWPRGARRAPPAAQRRRGAPAGAPARHRRARAHLRTVAPVPHAGHADRRRHHHRARDRHRAGMVSPACAALAAARPIESGLPLSRPSRPTA